MTTFYKREHGSLKQKNADDLLSPSSTAKLRDSTQSRWVRCREHFAKEGVLLRLYWQPLVLGLAFQYIHSVATHGAHVFHLPREPLPDIGFQLAQTLRISTDVVLSEKLFLFGLFCTGAFAAIAPLTNHRPNIYTTIMLTRFVCVLTTAQFLRILTFLATTLPSPNLHCSPSSPNYGPPRNLREVLTRPIEDFTSFRKWGWTGCGDQVFSSHMAVMLLCALLLTKYCRYRWAQLLAWGITLVFGVLLISSQKNYTVDITIALYTVPLVWMACEIYYPDRIPLLRESGRGSEFRPLFQDPKEDSTIEPVDEDNLDVTDSDESDPEEANEAPSESI